MVIITMMTPPRAHPAIGGVDIAIAIANTSRTIDSYEYEQDTPKTTHETTESERHISQVLAQRLHVERFQVVVAQIKFHV